MSLIHFHRPLRQQVVEFNPDWLDAHGFMTRAPEPEDDQLLAGFMIYNGPMDFPNRAEADEGFHRPISRTVRRTYGGLQAVEPLRFMISPGTTFQEHYFRSGKDSIRTLCTITATRIQCQAESQTGGLLDSPLGRFNDLHLWENQSDTPERKWFKSIVYNIEEVSHIDLTWAPVDGAYLRYLLGRLIRRELGRSYSVWNELPEDLTLEQAKARATFVNEIVGGKLAGYDPSVKATKAERQLQLATDEEKAFFRMWRAHFCRILIDQREGKYPGSEIPKEDIVGVVKDLIAKYLAMDPGRTRSVRSKPVVDVDD